MIRHRTPILAIAATGLALAISGCGTLPPLAETGYQPVTEAEPAPQSVLRAARIDRAIEDRILALNPERVTEDDVRQTLAKGPTPRIIGVHGGIYPVHVLMESFASFLTGMGYPEDRIRDAGDGSLSRSPYESSDQQAGLIAWYYEHEGLRPMLIGHSQGGIQVVKILHDLAGSFSNEIHVFNPLTQQPETRTTIVDPFTGETRPVVGVSVCYASAV